MLKTAAVTALVLGALLASGCSRKPTPTINESMTEIMEPQAQTIWDVTSRAYNDKGDGLEASKITPADWAKLEDAGKQLRDRSLVIAKAKRNIVNAPGETIMGEDASGAPSKIGHAWDAASSRQVQAWIDANPALFALHARKLAESGAAIVKAARTKDVQTVYSVSSGLDEVCDGCHEKFWGTDENPPYPK